MSLDITKLDRTDAMKILGTDEHATQDEINKAYKRLATACHPDKSGSTYLFQLVNNAHAALTDESDAVKPESQETAEKRPVKLCDLIYQKDFICPFKTFMAATEFPAYGMDFKGYHIKLNKLILNTEYIRTLWPADMTVKTYRNFLAYILDMPCESIQTRIHIPNKFPFSYQFKHTLQIRVKNTKARWFRSNIELSLLNARIENHGRIKKATRIHPAKGEFRTEYPAHISVECFVKFMQF